MQFSHETILWSLRACASCALCHNGLILEMYTSDAIVLMSVNISQREK